jgi:Fe-S-cluster containining protein
MGEGIRVHEIGFHCTACGKCCNSPPAMSMGELFRHRERFIGSLAIARVARLQAGARVAAGDGVQVLDDQDAAELAALQDALFHRPRASRGPQTGHAISLVTQAFDYPSQGRCPALASDGGCTVHGPDKPLMCRVVPLDPCVPDRMQAGVLRNRRASAAWLGASCIGAAAEPPYRPLVRQAKVADAAFAQDMAQRRADLAADKARWGRPVFGMLENELERGQGPRPGDDGWLVLPLAPVLAVLAAEGPAMRAQCLAYIDAQLPLIEATIGAALARKRAVDKPVTAQLRSFAQAYARQRGLLAGQAR